MKRSLLVFLVLSIPGFSQNWNVFNKNYRYNYKFNNSALVSQVLFADSVKQAGADTIYYLNRIGVPCVGSCTGINYSITPTTTLVLANMPQFLQRKVRKYSNGTVMFYDTAKIVLKPNCILNQTWLFDSTSNISATCVAMGIQNIFGITDSVKTLIVGVVDTVKLSKRFGLIVFPQLMSQNKYYRLVGIEKRATYDSTGLFGYKVPNAWDFYNYKVGDIFCHKYNSAVGNGSQGPVYKCNITQYSIISKSVSASGYTYLTDTYGTACAPTGLYTNNFILNFFGLSNDNLPENIMYPGMIFKGTVQKNIDYFGILNLVAFSSDVNNIFYKTAGGRSPAPQPFGPFEGLSAQTPTSNVPHYKVIATGSDQSEICFGERYGLVRLGFFYFEVGRTLYLKCFNRNDIDEYGQILIGLNEEIKEDETTLFPNPASMQLTIKVNGQGEFKIYSMLGHLVYNGLYNDETKIDVNNFENGMYTLVIKTSVGQSAWKIVVEH